MTSQYHKDTYEYLTREVYIVRRSHPTDIYLERFWHSLDHYRPDIDALIASLERSIQTRTNDIVQYPTDYAYINECRAYIQQDREWIALCAVLSQRAAENERKTAAILKELDRLREASEQRERERQARYLAEEAKQEAVQLDLFDVA